MLLNTTETPAEIAANVAIQQTIQALKEKKNFRVEAGAGAGKTYSLINALKYLIDDNGPALLRSGKRIACITYTEVARDQIKNKIDNNPVIYVETIHAFSWSLIKEFQSKLRELIPSLSEKWIERLTITPLQNQVVIYSLGYPKINEMEIFLHHDDVITLMHKLLYNQKFQCILESKFPIILIDEYQDTNKELAEAILNNFIIPKTGPLIGLFGDHWQKIYDRRTCGLITAPEDKLVIIGKNSNFRSDKNIVDILNKMRPDLIQQPSDPNSRGDVLVYHTNNYSGTRRTGQHWSDDLNADIAHEYLDKVKEILTSQGWSLNFPETKILMLTNNVLASEQGYNNLASVFEYPEEYLKKQDPYIEYFADVLEPAITSYNKGDFGEMFRLLKLRNPGIICHNDKLTWNTDMQGLNHLRENANIGQVIDFVIEKNRPKLTSRVQDREDKYRSLLAVENQNTLEDSERDFISKINNLRNTRYLEVIKLIEYINEKTPFSTKHGVKGDQFENVLVVLGRGWNIYNWNQMLEWFLTGHPSDKKDSFERNRNLFYVACSRPKHRLCLLFTQKLSSGALDVLSEWFGSESVIPLD